MSNTELRYQYRDANNYKVDRRFVVAGHDPELVGRLLAACDQQEYFLPLEVGLDPLQDQFGTPVREGDDHIWHELLDAEETDEAPTDGSLAEFVTAFEFACSAGWPEDASLRALNVLIAAGGESE